MPRIRTIKPDILLHEGLAELPYAYRWIFVGLWMFADSAGRLEDRPRKLRAGIIPYEEDQPYLMDEALEALALRGFIQRYEADGGRYIAIPSWRKHQRITGTEAQTPSRIPEPPPRPAAIVPPRVPEQQPGHTTDLHGDASGGIETDHSKGNDLEIRKGKERKGREGNGHTETGSPDGAPAGARVRPATTAEQPHSSEWGASPTRRVRAHIAWEAPRRNLSIPHDLHADLRDMSGWEEPRLFAWYGAIAAAWAERPIGDDVWRFWRARMREELGTTVTEAPPSAAGDALWTEALGQLEQHGGRRR